MEQSSPNNSTITALEELSLVTGAGHLPLNALSWARIENSHFSLRMFLGRFESPVVGLCEVTSIMTGTTC
jgi:hypothetical protein